MDNIFEIVKNTVWFIMNLAIIEPFKIFVRLPSFVKYVLGFLIFLVILFMLISVWRNRNEWRYREI